MRICKRHTAVRLLLVLLVFGGLVFLGVSCKTAGPANGTVTVTLINAAAQNGKAFMFAVFKEGANWMTDTPDGANILMISSGGAQGQAMDLDTGTTVVSFPGGGRYFVGALVDVNSDMLPTSGVDYLCLGSVFTVDGNMSQTLDFGDFGFVP